MTLDVDVMSIPIEGDDEHGLTMKDSRTGRYAIVVATTPHPMRQRSSIAHELGHVLACDLDADVELTPGSRSKEEIRADAFARHLLLPMPAVLRRHPPGSLSVGQRSLSDLVQAYGVSPAMAAIQLKNCGVINAAKQRGWSLLTAPMLASQYGWMSQYRAFAAESQSSRSPQSLMTRAVSAYQAGVLGINELAGWSGESVAELELELGTPQAAGEEDDWGIGVPLFPIAGRNETA